MSLTPWILTGLVELPCASHAGDEVGPDEVPGCPECGKMFYTHECWFCGATVITFGSGPSDDIMADASVSSAGDLMCYDCAVRTEQEELEDDDLWGIGDES